MTEKEEVIRDRLLEIKRKWENRRVTFEYKICLIKPSVDGDCGKATLNLINWHEKEINLCNNSIKDIEDVLALLDDGLTSSIMWCNNIKGGDIQ